MKTKSLFSFILLLATCLVGSSVFCSCSKEDHDYVDLGLPSGTLWATCNVGASRPEEYGDYFAWGETAPKSDYSWSTYKYFKSPEEIITKYCTSNDEGIDDDKIELEAVDDAATVNWGADWQMPSYEQFDELFNSSYTATTWTTLNGVSGYEITSKSNGNSIFLPAAGCRYDTSLGSAGSGGGYWSRSLSENFSHNACYQYFYSGGIDAYDDDRHYGRSVRPVRVKK